MKERDVEVRRRLYALRPDNPYGYWEIRGEDSNADLGGSHSEPLLTRVEAKYFDAVELALSLDGFWSWGAGGSVKRVEFEKLPRGSASRLAALREKRAKLVSELDDIDTEIRKHGVNPRGG